MIRKVTSLLLMMLIVLMMGGCWNYRSLNDLSITSGLAIDRNTETGLYHLTFEIVDLTGLVEEQGIMAKCIETDGETIFEGVRNVKKRIVDKLFFGHMELLLIGEEVARNTDISELIDFFLRDAECRETIRVAVAREMPASELIKIQGIGRPMAAYEINSIIGEDAQVTGSTTLMELYEIYNIMKGQGEELTLPAFHNAQNMEGVTSEAAGIAVYKGERLVGYLSPEESEFFLFVTDRIKGGVLTCPQMEGEPINTTLEVSKNSTNVSFDVIDGQIAINIKTNTEVFLAETNQTLDALDQTQIDLIERSASKVVVEGISRMIERVRTEYNSDIFGFGNLIYRQNPKLWGAIADSWYDIFPNMPINVTCQVRIVNTGSLKTS